MSVVRSRDAWRRVRTRTASMVLVIGGLFVACADKAPDPLWPEPPPPTLAEPIGQEVEPPPDDGSRAVGAMPVVDPSDEGTDESETDTGTEAD